MESSADDLVAPDSWESADLEESVKRLMISSQKTTDSPSPASTSAPEPVDALAGTRSSGRLISEDDLMQVDQFLREALEKPRERISVLRMEQDMIKFVRDPTRQQLEFEDLPTSYLRLAVHRLAQHYCLQSIAMPDNILPDGSGSRIIVLKTSYSKLPQIRLADIPINLRQEESKSIVKVAIKQRPHKSSQTMSGSNIQSSKSSSVKSVEARKEEYNKARARIFSHAGSSAMAKTEVGTHSQTGFMQCSFPPRGSDEKSFDEDFEFNLPKDLGDSFEDGNRLDSNRGAEQELDVSRFSGSNRVAIFRDREGDRKDPDYDRSYDRYMQRFDPGFGFNGGHYNGGHYTMQPMYSPAVSYNTEFPQLGSSHRPQVSIDHQPRPITQHVHGPWSDASVPSPIGYHSQEGMIPPFNTSFIGARPSSVYVHSSQHPGPQRLGMPFVHQHEYTQPFPQAHQQQSESNSGLARPH